MSLKENVDLNRKITYNFGFPGAKPRRVFLNVSANIAIAIVGVNVFWEEGGGVKQWV
jgi:hypothetical protein